MQAGLCGPATTIRGRAMTDSYIDADSLREQLKVVCAGHGGQAGFAARSGLSEALVSDVIRAVVKPGPKIARALGYRKAVVFFPLPSQKSEV